VNTVMNHQIPRNELSSTSQCIRYTQFAECISTDCKLNEIIKKNMFLKMLKLLEFRGKLLIQLTSFFI
jgi:hypothetical protein